MSEILHNFWVLEGLDGAGTTTQLKNLGKLLEERNEKFFITAEPTIYETGKFLRRVLSGEIKVPQSTVAHLFAADRDNHLNNAEYGIRKHLNDGEIVISDRYFFSSLAYQSIGFDYDSVWNLNSSFPWPDTVIFIDTPPEACISRINARGMAKEIYEKLDYQKKVRENYMRCFESLPQGCRLISIDGTLSREEIFAKLINQLSI